MKEDLDGRLLGTKSLIRTNYTVMAFSVGISLVWNQIKPGEMRRKGERDILRGDTVGGGLRCLKLDL